jgi:Glyoxalase-like domain
MVLSASLDHLVVHAATLEQGAAWCERKLGITPGPGGEHPLMGTHNRLLNLSAGAYLEIIAVNPHAVAPTHARWFDMDSPARLARVAREPELVHFAVNVSDMDAALKACPYDMGAALDAQRADFRWRMSVRPDGALHESGLIPTLIEWQSAHPTSRMNMSELTIVNMEFQHPNIAEVQRSHQALGFSSTAHMNLLYASAPQARMYVDIRSATGQQHVLTSSVDL